MAALAEVEVEVMAAWVEAVTWVEVVRHTDR